MPENASVIARMGQSARAAARALATTPAARIDAGLEAMAKELLAAQAEILEANAKDVAAAKASGQTAALVDRLTLDAKRLAACAEGLKQVATLPHPVGQVLREWTQPNGLKIAKVRVPLGVIGFIYESRPNVTVDA